MDRCGVSSDHFIDSKHKRKASVEDPAPAKQKARKAAAKPQSLEDGDEGSSVSQVPAKRKPKVNARSKSKKVIADTPETEDEEAGPSNTIKYIPCFKQVCDHH